MARLPRTFEFQRADTLIGKYTSLKHINVRAFSCFTLNYFVFLNKKFRRISTLTVIRMARATN